MTAIGIGATALIAFAGLLLIAALFAGTSQSERNQACMDENTREHIRTVMQEGIEKALQEQTVRLFGVRMREYTGSPQAALTGLNNSVAAYVNIRKAVKEWTPPIC